MLEEIFIRKVRHLVLDELEMNVELSVRLLESGGQG